MVEQCQAQEFSWCLAELDNKSFSKVLLLVLKWSAFEPWSQHSNKKKDQYKHMYPKVQEYVHRFLLTLFEEFLDNFLVQ